MNRAELWTIIAAALANVVLLWTIWGSVAANTEAIADNAIAIERTRSDLHQEIVSTRSELVETMANMRAELVESMANIRAELVGQISELKSEMIRETHTNREGTYKLEQRVNALESSEP